MERTGGLQSSLVSTCLNLNLIPTKHVSTKRSNNVDNLIVAFIHQFTIHPSIHTLSTHITTASISPIQAMTDAPPQREDTPTRERKRDMAAKLW